MNTSLEFFKSLIERDTKVMEMLLKDNTASSNNVVGELKSFIGGKPYSNIKFVNNVLTVVLNDGNIISKHPATADDFQRARNARNEVELFAVCRMVILSVLIRAFSTAAAWSASSFAALVSRNPSI